MHGIDNKPVIEPPITQTQVLSLTATGNSAGWSITVSDEEKKSSFQDLTSDTLSLIFRHLKLRDIRSLQKVCTRLRDVIKEDSALAKAWYRQFSSAHQNQLKMTLSIKDKNQFRAWFELFSNDKALLRSLTEREPTSVYSPALLFFTRAKLMSQCKTFELVRKATIDKIYKANSDTSSDELMIMEADNRVHSADLSADGRYLVTANGDNTAKIYGHKTDGTWEIKTTIPLDRQVVSAIFSPDGHHLVIVSSYGYGMVKVFDLGSNETWQPKATIRHDNPISSATFSTDSRHVVTASLDHTAKIYSQKDDGSWNSTAILAHYDAIHSAIFSTDGRHLLIACRDKTAKIYSQNGRLWEEKEVFPHEEAILSASFSADDRYVVTVGMNDCKARIYEKKSDGSWEENTFIQHTKYVKSATFSPDGRHLVTARRDQTVKIYGRKADGLWEEKASFFHDDWVFSATFSPDGRHVVTASKDGTAKIIGQQDDGSWLEKAIIFHDDSISSASFSADGSQVITSGMDGIVKITELRRNHSLSAVTE
ncbi:F-box/WD repeat-containing protein [Endozoicomonas sp. ALC020]|uniref:F-box/WD repeat-containing protein n=1 Tax=unclassified Endozoicomonas TaxID=2644528 RepID=UPI003BB15391